MPQCEFVGVIDPALLKVLLKIQERDGYSLVECGGCAGLWQVPSSARRAWGDANTLVRIAHSFAYRRVSEKRKGARRRVPPSAHGPPPPGSVRTSGRVDRRRGRLSGAQNPRSQNVRLGRQPDVGHKSESNVEANDPRTPRPFGRSDRARRPGGIGARAGRGWLGVPPGSGPLRLSAEPRIAVDRLPVYRSAALG
jgi:hypothetical protein